MKKTYLTPETTVIEIELSESLLLVTSGDSAGLSNPVPGHGPGRAPRHNDWTEWEGRN